MKKRIIAIAAIGILGAPFILLSCNSKTSALVQKKEHLVFLENNLQDSEKKKHMIADSIFKRDLEELPANLPALYGSDILVGGYGEGRYFYSGSITSNSKRASYHLGNDVLVPAQTRIVSPANGEVISYWWVGPIQPTIATGVGAEFLLRVKIENLSIKKEFKEMIYIKKIYKEKIKWVAKVPKIYFVTDGSYNEPQNLSSLLEYDQYMSTNPNMVEEQKASEYIYLYFMHLSKGSLNIYNGETIKEVFSPPNSKIPYKVKYNTSIDINHPWKVKKNELLGYVGNNLENGGWTPHVHLEAYVYTPDSRINRTLFKSKYILNPLPQEKDLLRYYFKSKAIGTYIGESWKKDYDDIRHFFRDRHYSIDTNEIYNLWNEKTPSINISTKN